MPLPAPANAHRAVRALTAARAYRAVWFVELENTLLSAQACVHRVALGTTRPPQGRQAASRVRLERILLSSANQPALNV